MAISSNIDLAKKERQRIEREEKQEAIVEDVLAKQTDHEFRGVHKLGSDLVISKSQDKMNVSDVLRRKREGKPIVPIAYHVESDTWILSDADQDAIMSGYVCENCLEWQEVPHSVICKWERTGGSCGYQRPMF